MFICEPQHIGHHPSRNYNIYLNNAISDTLPVCHRIEVASMSVTRSAFPGASRVFSYVADYLQNA